MSDQVEFKQDGRDSRRLERSQRRAERRAMREEGGLGWMAGILLIAIGVLYLLHDTGLLPSFTNWWALFLLLPGLGTLSAAIGAYRRDNGRLTPAVTIPFVASLFFLGMTLSFLFDLQFGWLWPLFLIAAGLLLLAAPVLSRD